DGKVSGLLLQGNKDNYRAILKALEAATGNSVAAMEKDREYLAETPTAKPASQPKPPTPKPVDEPKPVAAKPVDQPKKPPVTAAHTSKPGKTGTLSISSSPRAATVIVDGTVMGNTPSSLKLPPGEHSIAVSLGGYKDWVTSVTVEAGDTVSVKADLEKQ